ncbi:unnamed protein product, partial [Menidia menidia]
ADYSCDMERGSVCTYHPGSVHCVRGVQASPGSGSGQQCCYDVGGDLVLTGDSVGGGHPRPGPRPGRAPVPGPPPGAGLLPLADRRPELPPLLPVVRRLRPLPQTPALQRVPPLPAPPSSLCFGVNHLGHFLLTNLLLARLKECAPSRVVTLTCSSYKYQKLDFQDLNYNLLPFFTYCRSKLANIYFSQELARLTEGKGSGWTCHFSFLFRVLMRAVIWMLFVPCAAGAQTVVYCAVSDEAAQHSGGYFVDCRPTALRPFARDAGVAKKLWEASERLVKLA